MKFNEEELEVIHQALTASIEGYELFVNQHPDHPVSSETEGYIEASKILKKQIENHYHE